MARLFLDTSPISSCSPDSDLWSPPFNVSTIARTVHGKHGQHGNEDDDEVSSIITLGVNEVLGDEEKSGLSMECLSASSGSSYSDYGDQYPQCQSPSGAIDPQDPRDKFDWRSLNQVIDYPESVGWDSNSETQYSRSDTLPKSTGVGYIKNALSADTKSSSRNKFPPGEIIYPSPAPRTHPNLDDCDPSAFEFVMLKRAETMQEVEMAEHLNSEEFRRDPWNPAAPLLTIVNTDEPDDEGAILILERLQPYDAVPFKTVRDVVDLTRQLLQGLVFLHEQAIAHQGINPDTIMVETGHAPTDGSWERSEYDVRYYLVDFSHACWITDHQQVGLDLRHTAQSIKTIANQTLPELSPLLRKMGNRESTLVTAAQALEELELIVQSIPASRMSASLS